MSCKRIGNRTVCSGRRAQWWIDAINGGEGSIVDDYTNEAGQQVIGIFGDSKAAGNSNGVGETPEPNTVWQYIRTGSIGAVTNTDLLYVNNTGSQWPRVGIRWYNGFGRQPIFVQNGLGGSNFYSVDGGTDSWDTNGTLYSSAVGRINACLALAGVSKMKAAFIVLGVNDVNSVDTLATVLAAIPSLITRINNDFPDTTIYISIPGQSITPNARVGSIKKAVMALSSSFSNVHVTVNEVTMFSNGYYADALHWTAAGNAKWADMTMDYVLSTEADKDVRRVQNATFITPLSTAHKAVYKAFVLGQKSNGNWSKFTSLQIYRGSSKANVLTDLTGYTAARDFGFTHASNDKVSFDGVSTYMQTYFNPVAYPGDTTQNDFIFGLKTGNANTAAGVLATLYGNTTTARTMLQQTTTPATAFNANANAATNYTTDTKIQANTRYCARRSASNAIALLKNGVVVQSGTTVSGGVTNGILMVGCRGTAATPSEYWSGDIYYTFYAQNTGFDVSGFESGMETLLTGLAA